MRIPSVVVIPTIGDSPNANVMEARANNLLVGRAAYETAVRLHPRDVIHYRDGARIIERSDRD
jgi:hypothetical protein